MYLRKQFILLQRNKFKSTLLSVMRKTTMKLYTLCVIIWCGLCAEIANTSCPYITAKVHSLKRDPSHVAVD